VAGTTPFTSSSISFLAEDAGSLRFQFSSPSQDNVGPLLDDINLQVGPTATTFSPNPEPATWATMILGFGLIGGAMRKSRQPPVRPGVA
jgi:hypothetical protein